MDMIVLKDKNIANRGCIIVACPAHIWPVMGEIVALYHCGVKVGTGKVVNRWADTHEVSISDMELFEDMAIEYVPGVETP